MFISIAQVSKKQKILKLKFKDKQNCLKAPHFCSYFGY